MTTYDSTTILDADVTCLADDLTSGPFRYRLTSAEYQAIRWIGGRYASAEYVADHTDDDQIVTINPLDFGDAIRSDDCDRIPCLSNDTALQRIAWICAI